MKELFIVILINCLVLIQSIQLNAQESNIDFNIPSFDNSYKTLIKNRWNSEVKLVKLNSNCLHIKTEYRTFTFKKIEVDQIVDSDSDFGINGSHEIFMQNKLDTSLKTIVLKDGSELIGHIRDEDTLKIKFETLSGTMVDIKRNQIKTIVNERSDYFIGDDPNKTRLFFAPTGRNLKQGTGYFSVTELFFPTIAFGITDFFTAAGGISIVPGLDAQIYYLNGKARILHIKNLDLSAGLLYTNATSNDESGLTVPYAVGTYGTNNSSLSLGVGISLQRLDGDESSGSYPMFMLGGETKLSYSVKLISENWIPTEPESVKFFSLGVRFFGKRLAGDFGLVLIIDENGETIGGWPLIPWIGLNYNFDL